MALASALMSDKTFIDRRVLICWRHDTLQQLAECLGVSAPPWPEDLYDVFWRIELSGNVPKFRVESSPSPVA